MVKDFPWNIIPWNALLFEKTLKQLSILDIENNGFILNTCHDTAKRAETRVGFPVLFSSYSDDRLNLNFHRFVIIYRSCNTRSVGLGQYCLPKGSNGFKPMFVWERLVVASLAFISPFGSLPSSLDGRSSKQTNNKLFSSPKSWN